MALCQIEQMKSIKMSIKLIALKQLNEKSIVSSVITITLRHDANVPANLNRTRLSSKY